MRINSLNNFCYSNVSNHKKNNEQQINDFKYNAKNLSMPQDTVSFGQTSPIPKDVARFIKRHKKDIESIFLFAPEKLEGLQNGIEVFEGLSFSEIAYIINHLNAVIIQRGCNNACIHCFADAKTPHYMKENNLLSKMDFEDFENLCNGFKEINKRLGFNAFRSNKYTYKALFHDADCSMIYLQDKDGKIYDYADLAKMFHEATNDTIIFDTAGWNLNDKKTQKRMEDLVQKVVNSDDYNFLRFNVSINPFHSIYNRSLEFKTQGRKEEAKKLNKIFTDRIANVIFTFSPLIEKTNPISDHNMLDFIFRGLYDFTDLYGYCGNDVHRLFHDIVEKVGKMYAEDLTSGRHKVIHNKKQMDDYNMFLLGHLGRRVEGTNLVNKKLIKKLGEISAGEWNLVRDYTFNSAEKGCGFKHGLIDANGKFYMTNFMETYPTEISLNLKNKDRLTAPIAPNLRDKVITKELIES